MYKTTSHTFRIAVLLLAVALLLSPNSNLLADSEPNPGPVSDSILHNHWFNLGRLYLNTDYLTAEKHFRTAYQYDPDNIEKLAALAWVLIQNALYNLYNARDLYQQYSFELLSHIELVEQAIASKEE